MAQVDVFLKLDGIKGESKDAKHKGEIELVSFAWGVSNDGASAGGSGSRAAFEDLQVETRTSAASPELVLRCASGQHLKDATLTVRRGTQTKAEFLTFKLYDVLVTSLQAFGEIEEPGPLEEVTFSYGKIEWTYQRTDPAGKPDGPPIVHGWDLRQNKKV